MTPEQRVLSGYMGIDIIARMLHDAYEAAAVETGWQTNPKSRVPWDDVPEENRETMRRALVHLFADRAARNFMLGAIAEADRSVRLINDRAMP